MQVSSMSSYRNISGCSYAFLPSQRLASQREYRELFFLLANVFIRRTSLHLTDAAFLCPAAAAGASLIQYTCKRMTQNIRFGIISIFCIIAYFFLTLSGHSRWGLKNQQAQQQKSTDAVRNLRSQRPVSVKQQKEAFVKCCINIGKESWFFCTPTLCDYYL